MTLQFLNKNEKLICQSVIANSWLPLSNNFLLLQFKIGDQGLGEQETKCLRDQVNQGCSSTFFSLH